MTQLVLASESPRRRQLLALTGYPFAVHAADVDEASITVPDPALNCLQTAQLKARAVAGALPAADGRVLILAADTIVALGQQMLGKPADAGEARTMLAALQGRAHQVHTGMVLLDSETGAQDTAVHTAVVTMRSYTHAEIERYIAGGDPFDKAGAYAIQHQGFHPVRQLEGCFLSVMGLCICQLLTLFVGVGLRTSTDMVALAAAHGGFPCPHYDNIAQRTGK